MSRLTNGEFALQAVALRSGVAWPCTLRGHARSATLEALRSMVPCAHVGLASSLHTPLTHIARQGYVHNCQATISRNTQDPTERSVTGKILIWLLTAHANTAKAHIMSAGLREGYEPLLITRRAQDHVEDEETAQVLERCWAAHVSRRRRSRPLSHPGTIPRAGRARRILLGGDRHVERVLPRKELDNRDLPHLAVEAPSRDPTFRGGPDARSAVRRMETAHIELTWQIRPLRHCPSSPPEG